MQTPSARTYTSSAPAIESIKTTLDRDYIAPTFPIGPFEKFSHKPIITPNPEKHWESAFVYNPAALVIDNKVWLLYRAQGNDLISSIGLAWSDDGLNFVTLNRPVLTPTETYETGGGCEDPRIIYHAGLFYLTYTAFDGTTPRLALATSSDLLNWRKHGPLFTECVDAEYGEGGRLIIRNGVSKAGVIFTEKDSKGHFKMIFGEGHLQLAKSDDLISWKPNDFNEYFATGVHPWENRLLEPGPPPIKTKDGKYILVYNCSTTGGGKYAYNQYSVSQMLIDLDTIEEGPVARMDKPCLEVTEDAEREGQVGNVVFCEGLVQFKGKWLLYFGMGDQGIGLATCKAR